MPDLVTGLGGPGQQLAALDQSIAITELQLNSMQALESLVQSAPQILDVVSTMKSDLKGEAWKLTDLVDVQQVGDEFPYLKVKELDPLKVDGTQLPADLLATAVGKQEALTTLAEGLTTDFKAFADNQSGLLSGMKKLQAGLDKGSELFGKVETGIKRLEQGAELFEHLLNGEISDDKLMDAFTNYLATVADVLKPLTDTIPGLSDFLQAYVDAVKSMGVSVEKLRLHALDQEHVLNIWDDVFHASTPGVTSTTAPATAGPSAPSRSPIPALEARLIELRQQRNAVLDGWHDAVNAKVDIEYRQFLAEANRRLAEEKQALAAEGLTSLSAAEWQAALAERDRLVAAREDALKKIDNAAELLVLDEKIRVANATLLGDDDADRLQQHMVNALREHRFAYGPADLDYLIKDVGGAVGMAAAELRATLPEGSAAGAVLLHQDIEPQSTGFQRFAQWLLNSPRMVGLGLLGLVAVTIVGFLLFGAGDEEPDLIAAGDGAATATAATTATAEAAVTADATAVATATATEEPVMTQLAPPHVSICPDGTVLSGPVKLDPATGEPALDADGNEINADTDQPFVCE
jgi:hypothetical protein